MAGLAEVAMAAGVSISTVSRVLNRRPGVSDDARRRVLAALAEQPYTSRGLAALGRSGVIGLLLPELGNPVFPAFAEALETRAARRGYSTVLCNTRSTSLREEEYVRMLLARGVDAMVFVSAEFTGGRGTHDHYRRLWDEGVPMVFVNGTLPALDVPSISVDEEAAGYLATEHLLQLGHQRIGFVAGPARSMPTRQKSVGWQAALEHAGLTPDPALVTYSPYGAQGGAAGMARLLDAKLGVTAVICSSDLMAIGAMRECTRRGLRVPEDVSVVGFDDILLAEYVVPSLTTLAQPIPEMARAVIDVVVARVDGTFDPEQVAVSRRFRPRLVTRESTMRLERQKAATPGRSATRSRTTARAPSS